MKIFNTTQIREADQYTIKQEPIASIDLMERASSACFDWMKQRFPVGDYQLFCGTGNNGGDGLALARMLKESGQEVQVWIIRSGDHVSVDFKLNENRIKSAFSSIVHDVKHVSDFPAIGRGVIVVDALFGSGLSRPVSGLPAECIKFMNESGAKIISIDLPSGLFADTFTEPDASVVKATHTLTFQLPKFAFFFSSNEVFTGDWHVLDIGLDQNFIESQSADKNYFTIEDAKRVVRPRNKFSHKGNYGHALLASGSFGKLGAAILAARSCIRAGVGLLTVRIPRCGMEVLQTAVPEAMVSVDSTSDHLSSEINLELFSAIGVGPGIGTKPLTWNFLKSVLENCKKPMVIDADALNLLASHKEFFGTIPPGSILTPHPKEFERLTKKSKHDFERHELQIQFAKENQVYVVLKGAYTCTAAPDGKVWFNSSGNPGMARGGSGDALTGVILGLLAQSYTPLESALLGVFLHGLAGDEAANIQTVHSMTPTDLIRCLPRAFKKLS